MQNESITPAEKRRRLGYVLIAAGVFFCLVGFVATVILFDQGVDFHFAMYSATGTGGMLIVCGLAVILG